MITEYVTETDLPCPGPALIPPVDRVLWAGWSRTTSTFPKSEVASPLIEVNASRVVLLHLWRTEGSPETSDFPWENTATSPGAELVHVLSQGCVIANACDGKSQAEMTHLPESLSDPPTVIQSV